jgi:acetate kinase
LADDPEHNSILLISSDIKYGFHGLSYMSILGAMAKKLNKKKEDVSIVVAHLGSGGSSCCIRKGKSIDTSKLGSDSLER